MRIKCILFLFFGLYFQKSTFGQVFDGASASKAFSLNMSMEIINLETGEILNPTGKIDFIKLDGFTLIKTMTLRTFTKARINSQNEIIEDPDGKQDTVYNYNIFRNGAKLGKSYRLIDSLVGHTFSVDSLFKSYGWNEVIKFDVKGFNLVEEKRSIDGKVISEKYKRDKSINSGKKADSIYLDYDQKFSDLSFSLSPRIDQVKNNKLAKVTAVIPTQEGEPSSEKRRVLHSMVFLKEEKIIDFDLIKRVIRQFESDFPAASD